ncbi:hypothetical protein PoB_000863500 [Plakobranchus ocellatus]|uniref:Uncharacterized protein n=1 Tax=Plakobranchus ocellatus TaxID=259542 RepID=A0AAV3YGC0_9GAST|nr:hypothetical protein PoB_000863500 [Plakobranchus ocellatus]
MYTYKLSSAPYLTLSVETTQGPDNDNEGNEALLHALLPKLEPVTIPANNSTRRRASEAVNGPPGNSKVAKPPLPQKTSSDALNTTVASPRSSGPSSAKASETGTSSRKQSSVSMKAAAATVAGVRKAAAQANNNNAGGKGSKTCVLQ